MANIALTREDAITELLQIYAQLDDLIRQICKARVESAPDAEAREALSRQVEEERRHVEIQRAFLRERGTPYEERIPPEVSRALLDYFLRLDWPEFVSAMQLTVEGMGTLAVRQVCELADEATRRALEIPLKDEESHIGFGVRELRKALEALSPEEQEVLRDRVRQRVRLTMALTRSLPSDLRDCFEAAGLDYAALNARIHEEAARRWKALGLDLGLAA
jgi:hypothetical protein